VVVERTALSGFLCCIAETFSKPISNHFDFEKKTRDDHVIFREDEKGFL
jgi:hypothetical protein